MSFIKQLFIALFCIGLSAAAAGQTVFKTPNGNRYHLANCQTVRNVSREIPAEEARKLGLTPCLVCRPANIYGGSAPVVHKAKGQGESVQCKAMTKAGTRCKHRTRIGNGLCFQHGG